MVMKMINIINITSIGYGLLTFFLVYGGILILSLYQIKNLKKKGFFELLPGSHTLLQLTLIFAQRRILTGHRVFIHGS